MSKSKMPFCSATVLFAKLWLVMSLLYTIVDALAFCSCGTWAYHLVVAFFLPSFTPNVPLQARANEEGEQM